MNNLAIVCIIVLITILAAIAPSCAEAALELSNLTIIPQEIESRQSATISVDITNTGGAEGTCPVVLKIDSVQTDVQNVTVGPGATQQASFTVTREEAGSYTVEINGLAATLKVLKPAEFKTEALVVSPTEVAAGGSSTVTVGVTNIGEVEGDYEVILRVNDEVTDTKKVTIPAGVTETVSFTLFEDEWGTYNLSVNGLSGTLTVSPTLTLPKYITDLYNLPEIKDGISSQEADAIEKVKSLSSRNDPEVEQGLRLIGEYGIPPKTGSKYAPVYPIPAYNTQLQVLFWLALNKDIDKDYDRVAIALALDYGVVVTYGDDQVDQSVKQYICQLYDYVRETDEFLLQKNCEWQAKDYPLEADMLLVWGACGMRYPTFYDHVGQTGKTPWTHFWYTEFEERPMDTEDFDWLFVSIETLKEMKDWGVQKGFAASEVSKVADNMDAYAQRHLHCYSDRPDTPLSYVEVEGKITLGCRLSNPDWQWRSLKETGEFLGNCEDVLYMGCMLLKSLNIAVGEGSVKAEGLAHAVILYYCMEDDVLRTTPNQLGIIESHAKGEIVYSYHRLPWENLHQLRDSVVIIESSDKKILGKGISTEYVLK